MGSLHIDRRTVVDRIRDAMAPWVWWATFEGARRDGVLVDDACHMADSAVEIIEPIRQARLDE